VRDAVRTGEPLAIDPPIALLLVVLRDGRCRLATWGRGTRGAGARLATRALWRRGIAGGRGGCGAGYGRGRHGGVLGWASWRAAPCSGSSPQG
jgi:hypothetical protein